MCLLVIMLMVPFFGLNSLDLYKKLRLYYGDM